MPENILDQRTLPQGWKTSIGPYLSVFVERFCAAEDLATYDPYDIWMTPLGFAVKNFYNRWPVAGLPPAGLLSVFRSEEHTSELQSLTNLVCRLLLETKNDRH